MEVSSEIIKAYFKENKSERNLSFLHVFNNFCKLAGWRRLDFLVLGYTRKISKPTRRYLSAVVCISPFNIY